jgi:hypothetical protein
MNTRADVFDFLIAVDARSSVLSLADNLLTTDDNAISAAIQDAFAAVEERLTDRERPVVDATHMMLYERIQTRPKHLKGFGVPNFIESLLSVLYLRLKADLRAHGSKSFLRNPPEALRKVRPGIAALGPDFFGELLVEAELRASRDAEFAATLTTAAKELSVLAPRLDALQERARILFKKKKDDEECSCIVRACNALGDCQDFCIGGFWVCVLIFLAIITILVLT